MTAPDIHTVLGSAGSAGAKAPQPSGGPARTGPRRSWLVPVLVLVGFIAVFAWATWERWQPAMPVDVVRVEAVRQRGDVTAAPDVDRVAFQAAGWIEPDPFAVRVTALVSGIVTEVPVREGEAVESGQVLARLDPTDAELALSQAQAQLRERAADLAAAESQLTILDAEARRLQSRIAAQEALVAERQDQADRLSGAGRAVSVGEREQGLLRTLAAEQDLAALSAEGDVIAARRQEAEAAVAQRQAEHERQQVAVELAQVDLERTVIRAPVAGIISRLYALPGRKQMLGGESPISTTVAEIFDPADLQVRVDVALADANGLFIGQRARISSEVWPDRDFTGVVTRLAGHADLTRNTLQAKVRIEDPAPLMRPEMLCRVQFLARRVAAGQADAAGSSGKRLQLLVPIDAVAGEPGGTAQAWMVDADGRAKRTTLELGGRLDDAISIRSGVPAGALLIVDAPADLSEGQRVAYSQEHP